MVVAVPAGVLQDADPGVLREVCLARLRRLMRILREHEEEFNEIGKALISQTVFSTFLDLRDLGYREEASAVLPGQVPAEFLQ